jgi:CheY-like chemotaxis protein
VEDDAMVRALAARILQSLGYRTVVTEFAQAALKCLAAEPEIKLILSDVVLPGGTDGFELAKQARQMKPDLPVLFVSGYPQPAPLRRGGPDRVDAVLQKPYTTEQLARAVGRALDREKVESRPPETC